MNANAAAATLELVDAGHDLAVDTRRSVHSLPELAFEERQTSALIHERLAAPGFRELPCPTETGAVFQLDGGRPGRTVLLRADIDALPVEEQVDVPFRSRLDGQMHACGHDGHVAILLASAAVMARRAEDLPGSYVFLFQPGEEFGYGARKMIEGGVLDGFHADRAIGLHLAAPLPAGLVGVRSGVQYSRAQAFKVRLTGAGAHAAMAGADGNVVLAVSSLSSRLAGVVADLEYEFVGCACTAGMITAGTAPNVVPQHATLEGTFRTFNDAQYEVAAARLRELCAAIEAEFSITAELSLAPVIPEVINDATAVDIFRAAAGRAIGEANVFEAPPVQPSDDVSEFLNRIPGVYFLVGARPGTGIPPMHHAPDFRIDEESLRVGTRTMVAGALALAAPD
ncbi:MAG: M20 metallopeptidase family protein [Candidatus Dormibacteria bacterium]